jgi:hypothetical protein
MYKFKNYPNIKIVLLQGGVFSDQLFTSVHRAVTVFVFLIDRKKHALKHHCN